MIAQLNRELLIKKHRNGVQLLEPAPHLAYPTLEQFMGQDVCIFMNNNEHVVIDDNLCHREAFGHEMIGLSLEDILTDKKQIHQMRLNNNQVLSSKTRISFDEFATISDHEILNGISVKMPWYNQSDDVMGILGFSLIFKNGMMIIKNSDFINALNLFAGNDLSSLYPASSKTINGIYFTAREMEVIQHVLRGKTLRETAALLSLSPRTIESYFENIKIKANVRTRSELIEKVMLS